MTAGSDEARPDAPTPRQLRELYEHGANISQTLRELGVPAGERIIEAAYDLQSGSYVDAMNDPSSVAQKRAYSEEFAGVVAGLGQFGSLLKAGVSEAITLAGLLEQMPYEFPIVRGFDLCWSRTAFGRRWLAQRGFGSVELCTGSLAAIPFQDDSFDVVCTSHSIEPNGGAEVPILRELHRVARRFVVLLEPSYEMASDEGRARMDRLGYCRGLPDVAAGLGFDVIEHRPIESVSNVLNPTQVLVISKGDGRPQSGTEYACPQYRVPLEEFEDGFYSPEALAVYPRLGGIPCLRVENQIVASHYPSFSEAPTEPSRGEH